MVDNDYTHKAIFFFEAYFRSQYNRMCITANKESNQEKRYSHKMRVIKSFVDHADELEQGNFKYCDVGDRDIYYATKKSNYAEALAILSKVLSEEAAEMLYNEHCMIFSLSISEGSDIEEYEKPLKKIQ